jgi:hypothetical protein
MSYNMEIGGVDMAPYAADPIGPVVLRTSGARGALRMSADGMRWIGPRRAQRIAEYRARRALLGTDEGRNSMVDACRVLAGMSMTRRANRAKAGSSAAGKARGAGRGQTPPMTIERRAEHYGMRIDWGMGGVEYDTIVGGTARQLRQVLRMGTRLGEIGPGPESKGYATPPRSA